jgi:hypothetical protein
MPQTNKPRKWGSRVRVHTDWNNPRAYALCDGCKMLTYRDSLQMQKDYRGGLAPVETGFLVCPKCYDQPQAQFSPPMLKPDPVPTFMPRPDDHEPAILLTEDGHAIATEDDLTQIEIT